MINGQHNVLVHVRGTMKQIVDVAQQLARLCAIFKAHRYDELTLSVVRFGSVSINTFEEILREVEKANSSYERCEFLLFENGMIAQKISTLWHDRKNGIEALLAVMTTLSCIYPPIL